MPHSSGGSSHRGGTHHSSHHHSGGGSSAPSHIYDRHYRHGAYRYVRYNQGNIEYLYSDRADLGKNAEQKSGKAGYEILMYLLMCLPFFLILIFFCFSAVYTPKRLDFPDYGVEVHDRAQIFKDTSQLRDALKQFYDSTGITIAVDTVMNSEWESNYTTLERYAYDEYIKRYPDEKHWLLVYSTNKNTGFEDWYFEGMQGDLTDPIITTQMGYAFTDTLDKRILDREHYSLEDAFAVTIQEYSNKMMETSINGEALIMPIIFSMVLVFWIVFAVLSNPRRKYKDFICTGEIAQSQEEEQINARNCAYCGGLYYLGTVMECPHCGAAIPAE